MQALALSRRILPPDHPDIALRMGNLASAYGNLGRHAEALVLKEKVSGLRSGKLN